MKTKAVKTKPATSLYLTQPEIEALLKIAAFCGFYQTRGGGMRLMQGNLSGLNRAIAKLPPEQWLALKKLLEKVNTL